MKKRYFVVIALVLAIVLFACRKQKDGPYWDTHVLGPLLYANLSINNLLADSILQANPDSSLKIVYQTDVYKLDVDTIFKIPDTSLLQSFNLPLSVTLNPGQTIVNNNTSETTYSLPGVQLRTVTIKSGKVHYHIKSKIHEKTNFVYSIPPATKNGSPFLINVDVPAAVGSTPGIYDATFDLSNYIIDLTGITHSKVNTLYTSLTARVSQDASGSVLVNNSDSLIIENEFLDIIPYYAKGYFGQNTFNIGPDSTEFSVFKKIVDGTVQLEDVNFTFNIRNPIGLDARILINNLSSINTRTGTAVNLTNSIVGTPININRASESGGYVYPYNVSFPLTTSNSNIKQMVENLPDKFGYAMEIVANPLGNISGSNDFIYSDNLLNASMNLEIPLSLVATNLTLVDTVNLSVSGAAEDLKSGIVTIFADNGFPFDASLQMYMLDDMNVVVDSIFPSINTIDEAPVDTNYKVSGKRLTKIAVTLTESKMNQLLNTKKMILKVKFNTVAQSNFIKIYSNYSIDVKLVGDLNYTIHLN